MKLIILELERFIARISLFSDIKIDEKLLFFLAFGCIYQKSKLPTWSFFEKCEVKTSSTSLFKNYQILKQPF